MLVSITAGIFGKDNDKTSWQVDVEYDELTRKESVRLYCKSLYPIKTRTGENYVYLNIDGDGEKISIWIWWDKIISVDNAYLTYRTGENDLVESESWNTSSNYEYTFAPNDFELLLKLIKSFHSMFRVTPHMENSVTAEFITSKGLENLLLKHKKAFMPLWDWNENASKRTSSKLLEHNINSFFIIKNIVKKLRDKIGKGGGYYHYNGDYSIRSGLRYFSLDVHEDDVIFYIKEIGNWFFFMSDKIINIKSKRKEPLIIRYDEIESVSVKSKEYLLIPNMFNTKLFINGSKVGRFTCFEKDEGTHIKSFINELRAQ